MESERPNTTIETYEHQHQLQQQDDDEEEEEEEEKNNEILKRRISSHPLYGLLVEAHLDCLKVPFPLFLSTPSFLLILFTVFNLNFVFHHCMPYIMLDFSEK